MNYYVFKCHLLEKADLGIPIKKLEIFDCLSLFFQNRIFNHESH